MRVLFYYQSIVIYAVLLISMSFFSLPAMDQEMLKDEFAGNETTEPNEIIERRDVAGEIPIVVLPQNNNPPCMADTCNKIDTVIRHPSFLLWPALFLQIINNIYGIANYPSDNNCMLQSDFALTDGIYTLCIIGTLIMIHKGK